MWVRPLGWEENPWRRKWQPTPVSLPGESHGRRSLIGYSPWGHKESDTTEWLFTLLYFTYRFTLLFSHSVVSDSLQPYRLQHTRLPYPTLSPGIFSNSCLLSRWCHPTISSYVTRFSSCPQSFPASGSFPMCQLFESCGQNIGTSESIFPMNIQGWFPLASTSLILQSKDS